MPLTCLLQDIYKAGLVFFAKVFARNFQGDKKMRYLRLFCASAALTCALALSTYAGDIECDLAPRTSPAIEVTGGIECDGLTEIAVSLLQTVLLLS